MQKYKTNADVAALASGNGERLIRIFKFILSRLPNPSRAYERICSEGLTMFLDKKARAVYNIVTGALNTSSDDALPPDDTVHFDKGEIAPVLCD